VVNETGFSNTYRMKGNYLKGVQGDVINGVMTGAAFNFKRWLNQKLKSFSGFVQNMTRIHLEYDLLPQLRPMSF